MPVILKRWKQKSNRTRYYELYPKFIGELKDVINALGNNSEQDPIQIRIMADISTTDVGIPLMTDILFTKLPDAIVGLSDTIDEIRSDKTIICIGNEVYVDRKNLRGIKLKMYYRKRDGDSWEFIEQPLRRKFINIVKYRKELHALKKGPITANY